MAKIITVTIDENGDAEIDLAGLQRQGLRCRHEGIQ